jgi:hypothetical protein
MRSSSAPPSTRRKHVSRNISGPLPASRQPMKVMRPIIVHNNNKIKTKRHRRRHDYPVHHLNPWYYSLNPYYWFNETDNTTELKVKNKKLKQELLLQRIKEEHNRQNMQLILISLLAIGGSYVVYKSIKKK